MIICRNGYIIHLRKLQMRNFEQLVMNEKKEQYEKGTNNFHRQRKR